MTKITNQADLEFRGWKRIHSQHFRHEIFGEVTTNDLAQWVLKSALYNHTHVLKATTLAKACVEAEDYMPPEAKKRKKKADADAKKPTKKKRKKRTKTS